jgi:predicted CoA-binding protein
MTTQRNVLAKAMRTVTPDQHPTDRQRWSNTILAALHASGYTIVPEATAQENKRLQRELDECRDMIEQEVNPRAVESEAT